MKNILYIVPSEQSKSGIKKYSNIMISAFNRYSSEINLEKLSIHDLYKKKYKDFTLKKLKDELISQKDFIEKFDGILCDIGLSETLEFHTIMILKELFPNLSTFVVIHDPPKTINNLNPFFETRAKSFFGRATRKLYNQSLGKLIESRFFKQNHTFIVLSNKGKKILTDKLSGFKIENPIVKYIPHVNFYEGEETLKESNNLKEKKNKMVIGYFGFLAHSKGIDILIDSFLKIKSEKATLKIAGEALYKKDKAYSQDLMKKNELDQMINSNIIEFQGFLEENQVPKFIQELDLLVLPYRATNSGSASGPLAWARSFGKPVIASDTRHFPEMIKHGEDGLLFEANSVEDLTSKLKEVIDNQDVLSGLESGSLKRKKENSWKSIVSLLETIINN